MKAKLFTFFAALICATTSWAGPILSGSGTKDDPYLIGSLKDWREFSIYVSNNYTPFDECYKLTADIGPINDINYIIGYLDHPFKGILDGDGHTLTMDFDSDTYGYVSPFFNIYDATIKNLHVTGEVTAAEPYAAGLVQEVESYYGNTIENCRVSTKIICNATTSGECMIGGFVGSNPDMELNITGCVFDGQIIAPNLTGCAGFVGWNDADRRGNVNITDCVFAPTAVNVQGGMTFVRSSKYGEDEYGVEYVKISNSYYTAPLGDAQGKAVHTITGNEGVTVAMAGEPKAYNMSNITTYSGNAGLQYNNIIYAGSGDVVSLNLSGSDYAYTSTAGTLSGVANPFTLRMEDADAVVSALQTGEFVKITTDSELRAAIQIDGVKIQLAKDIDLSNSTLSIESGKTVTIDLGGHTLDRKLTKRGEGGGQVITVRSGATLNLTGGTLKGGWGGAGGALVNEGGTVTLANVNIINNVADDRGGGICNREGGTLVMTGGVITGNGSNDHSGAKGGGGLFNEEGATATLTGVTITGNTAKLTGGGGICNFGTLTIDGCTIQDNTAGTQGGAIWQEGTLNMQGAMTVTNNTAGGATNNLFLKTNALITVTGSLAGSSISLNMESGTGVFTSGYNTNNSGTDPATIFTADLPEVMVISLDAGEAKLGSSLPEGAVYYIQREWKNMKMVTTTKTLATEIDFSATPTSEDQYKVLTSNGNNIYLGTKNATLHEYYVVRDNVRTGTLIVQGPKVHIILCDGAKLDPTEISVIKDHTVYIHVQSYESAMGKLYMTDSGRGYNGIGGKDRLHNDDNKVETGGTIEIHGGDIKIKHVNRHFAAIGGLYDDKACNVTIYGGNIYAEAGYYAAGIGGGNGSDVFGEINIYDGTIEAIGGDNDMLIDNRGGAGIGGAPNGHYGVITIYGGNITARGKRESAGIGSSQVVADGYQGEINIYGGTVKAYGDDYGAGIGGGDSQDGGKINIFGGEVYAYGGTDAAGIGGGEGGNAGTIRITDGYVEAHGGNEYGAGIGGGQDGNGGNIEITGGTVIAKAGMNETGCRAIGPGAGSDDYGSLTIGDVMMVTSERMASTGERRNMCWYRTQVRVEYCTHKELTYTVNGNGLNDTHTAHCKYCNKQYDAEPHNFVNGACTVCGITQTSELHTIKVYLPAQTGYADPIEYKFLHGAVFNLPTPPEKPEMYIPQDLAFAGWVEGETPSQDDDIKTRENENLLYAGTEYIVEHDANLIARYNRIWITLHNEKHNGENLAIYNGKLAEEVILEDRTLYYDGRWNTICLPFDLDDKDIKTTPLDGATIKTLESSSFDSSTGTLTLNFTENSLTSIEAGKPYIVKWSKEPFYSDLRFTYVFLTTKLNPVKTTAAEGVTVTFAGAYSPMFIRQENKNLFYLGVDQGGKSKLYYPSQAMTIGSCRAHFRLDGITAGDPAAGVRAFVLNFGDEDNDADGIGSINGLTPDPSLLSRGEIYNLSGQRLSKPQKGINIINGKKILF